MLTGHRFFQVCINNGAWLVVDAYIYIPFTHNLLLATCAGKKRRGRLVNWVEKGNLQKIRRLLEVAKQESYHKGNLTPYNLPVILCSLPS